MDADRIRRELERLLHPVDTRRAELRQLPFSSSWRRILARTMPLYAQLPRSDRTELEGHAQVLLAEKVFEGCGGVEITDEIRVTIATQAAVLLLHREVDYYPHLVTILVYPTAFNAPVEKHLDQGWEAADPVVRLGETGSRLRAMVLSWEDVLSGAANISDGQNVVFHEFAHQLDYDNGATDGTPAFDDAALAPQWAAVMTTELERLRREVEAGIPTLIDDYGAKNPAEFFAEATECYFERPWPLRQRHPELFEVLRAYYRFDPSQLLP
jgi:Mlc titration factor MtfA (ptsG expression regulator)